MKSQTLTGAWQFRQAGRADWLGGQVPGGVHTDLMAAGRIPDPFAGDNELQVAWVAESDWEYRRTFTPAPEVLAQEQVWLVCDGLDTLAEVALNGEVLGRTENMFRQYRWEVKALLKEGPNEVGIVFRSPVQYAAEKQAVRALPGVSQAIVGGPYVRKAPCQFGWDWGPQLPPVGIWKDIRLEGYSQGRIGEVHLRQEHGQDGVTVIARVAVEAWGGGALEAKLRLTAPDGGMSESQAVIDDQGQATLRILVREPELWWPNGYGAQPLYRAEIELLGEEPERIVDQRAYQIGLRTIELRQEPDKWGRSFEFVVNGVRIFAKGSNWIPADSFPTRITDEHLEFLIQSAAESHQNMLRVWGGGFYEEERFYDLCDRYGILVWQDFIFSCSVYPLNEAEFVENVRVEVVENVRRLRHRASLALWCGNNEMEQGWVEWGWQLGNLDDLKEAYDRFFHHSLPEWCAAEDPDHSYWPSSPSSGDPFKNPNGQRQGDAHYWDVWHGRRPFTAYRSQYPRFMSEFGFQALPPLETIRTYAQEADWNMTSYIMEQHQKNASGNGLIIAQMTDNFRMPKDFPALVYVSMVLQAEGIRYGVEHWRRHKERVAGTIIWQLNDCWPVASWSSLDYFGRWKALHYAARRFYAPLLLSIEELPARPGTQKTAEGYYSPPLTVDERPVRQVMHVTSDLGQAWEGEIEWSLETLNGARLAGGREAVRVGPHASILVCDLDFSEFLTGKMRREVVFVAELQQGGQRVALQTAAFAPAKHLALVDPQVQAALSSEDGTLVVELKAESLARLVEVSLEGVDTVFSDNYFDLPAGRTARVTCRLPEGWSEDQARQALRVRSVYDSYAH